MSSLGTNAKQFTRRLNYTEYEAEEMTARKAESAGDAIDSCCEEPRLDELWSVLGITADLDPEPVEVTARDVALAAWSNWGAGTFKRASSQSTMSEENFIILHDSFHEITDLV